MPLKLLRVVPTPGLSKKYAAVFLLANGRQRTVRFGMTSTYVSNPRKTACDRAAYIARHHVNENHNNFFYQEELSYHLEQYLEQA